VINTGSRTITVAELEDFYDWLAEAVDEVAEKKVTIFLAKLALLLAREARDPAVLKSLIEDAATDL
jgi:DNA-binding ferritin-like protein